MIGKLVWYSKERTQGVIQVLDERGVVSKYFLLESQVVQRPQEIKVGYYVKFRDALQPRRPDLLPVAVAVVVSEHPLTEHSAGANALAKVGV